MRKSKRLLAMLMSLVLLLPMMSVPAFADEAPEGVINISSDWQGSVFGSVGGQNKIATDNFGITENGDGTVTLRSANKRGKISDGVDGIAYYFKEVPADADFELTATATVNAWTTGDNQVSFGLMLRDQVAYNVSDDPSGKTDYVAAGALNQGMEGFARMTGEDALKHYAPDTAVDAPAADNVYTIRIKKSGTSYALKINDGEQVISDYSGAVHYAGLFTARNTTVTYSDIHLKIDGVVELGDWQFSAFGSNTGSGRTPAPTINEDGSVTLYTEGGKIKGGSQGMSFYYKEVPAGVNFEIETKATVVHFDEGGVSTPKQKSFGLMLRDQVGTDGDNSEQFSNLVAVGALDTVIEAVYQQGAEWGVRDSAFDGVNPPAAGEVYDLKIQKSKDTYTLTANGHSEVITAENMFSDPLYAGFYVARDAEVTFSDFKITVEAKAVSQLIVDDTAMNKNYLIGQSLDLTGLIVKAKYSDDSEAVLSPEDYVASGFDSSAAGSVTVTIHYGGQSEEVHVQILALDVTQLSVKYLPAKTTYYVGDAFDPKGFVVEAEYNDGYLVRELTDDLYTFTIPDTVLDGTNSVFNAPGTKTVTVTSTETPATTTTFDVVVNDATISELRISQPPAKSVYYIGDSLDLDGLVVYAKYSDGAEIRLMKDEYAVSSLDSSTAGSKEITVSYKGATAKFTVTVQVKQLTGIEVSQYPKTLYTVGEHFDPAGMEISKVFDNGDREILPGGQYTVDASGFDDTQAGVYGIHIVPSDGSIEAIVLNVTVREKTEYEWKTIRFGQSTSSANNKVTVNEDGTVKLEALGGSAGKVTGDHDGISFYYTEIDAAQDNFVLSADVKVVEFGKATYDGQESFGIMARDAIGTPDDSSIFASNIAAVGGYSGGTKNPVGTQLFVRTGVETPDGAGSQGIQAVMLQNERPSSSNTYPTKPYRLTLAKTNSGYTGQLNDGTTQILYTPDILNVQDNKIYVGFYAARLATIEVSNIEFTVTAAETDPPKVEPPAQPVAPQFEIVSLDKTPETAYQLMVKSNVNGTVTVKQGPATIAQDQEVQAGGISAIPATLAANGGTNFSITFLPDDTQYLTAYDKIVQNFTVTVQSYTGDIYVSPTGTSGGLGTESDPLDLDTAIAFVKAGQLIVMLDGRYVRHASLNIAKYNDGTEDAMKWLVAADGARPIVDFDKKSEGVLLSGNYWHVKGIDFTRSAGNTKGFNIGGSHNIVESSRFYENGDTGLQISRTDITENDKSKWPSYNLILNSESFDNRDPSDNNADGFAAKLTSGVGNVFKGCISHNNIDDGWDLYTKAGTGAIGAVTIEDSIAYNNGSLTTGEVGQGDKNGFKLGGEGIDVAHTIRNSIAFGNGAIGFTSNSNPGVIAIDNIGFNNARGNLSFTTYSGIVPHFTIDGFVSYQKDFTAKDNYPAELSANNNYMFNGTVSANRAGLRLSDANFVSLEPALPYERDGEGGIIRGDFLKFTAPVPNAGSYSPGSGSNLDSQDEVLTIPPILSEGLAKSVLDANQLDQALSRATADSNGVKRVQVEIPEVDGAEAYGLSIPASFVAAAGGHDQIAVSTKAAQVVLPAGLLENAGLGDVEEVTLRIAAADISNLPDDTRQQIGNRPVVELSFTAGGQPVEYNNPAAPVVISIPYEPTAEEMNDPEHITVWYVDGSGAPVAVPSGRYDAQTGKVTFTAVHFSQYAVVFVWKSFEDLGQVPWARNEIEVMASKGVIHGTSATTYSPDIDITRADFTLLLIKSLGLYAAADSSFADVAPTDYYYEAVAIAERLGIVSGKEDGLFYPKENISRQDMFVMTARALRAAGVWEAGIADLSPALDAFADGSSVSAYAADDLAAMVQAGLVMGDAGNRLNPLANSTRAEAAAMIYRIYSLQ